MKALISKVRVTSSNKTWHRINDATEKYNVANIKKALCSKIKVTSTNKHGMESIKPNSQALIQEAMSLAFYTNFLTVVLSTNKTSHRFNDRALLMGHTMDSMMPPFGNLKCGFITESDCSL